MELLMVMITQFFMKKLIIKIITIVFITFGFLIASVFYLNKVNRAIESSTKLMLLPESIPLRAQGEQFYVYILLNSQLNEISAVDAVVKFDNEVLEAIDIVPLDSFPTYPEASRVIDNNNGLIYLSAVNFDLNSNIFTEPYQNIGQYGRISFRVKKSQPTIIDFVYTTPEKTNETNIIEATTGKSIIYDKSQLIGVAVK